MFSHHKCEKNDHPTWPSWNNFDYSEFSPNWVIRVKFSGKIGNQSALSTPLQHHTFSLPQGKGIFIASYSAESFVCASGLTLWLHGFLYYQRFPLDTGKSCQSWTTCFSDGPLFLESEMETVKRKAGSELRILTPWARHLSSSKGGQPVTLFSQMYSPLSLTLQRWLSQPSWNISSRWNQRRQIWR